MASAGGRWQRRKPPKKGCTSQVGAWTGNLNLEEAESLDLAYDTRQVKGTHCGQTWRHARGVKGKTCTASSLSYKLSTSVQELLDWRGFIEPRCRVQGYRMVNWVAGQSYGQALAVRLGQLSERVSRIQDSGQWTCRWSATMARHCRPGAAGPDRKQG